MAKTGNMKLILVVTPILLLAIFAGGLIYWKSTLIAVGPKDENLSLQGLINQEAKKQEEDIVPSDSKGLKFQSPAQVQQFAAQGNQLMKLQKIAMCQQSDFKAAGCEEFKAMKKK